MSPASANLTDAVQLLKTAQHAVAFTGAGLSTPSGIPDFRSANTGLWQRFDPMEVASLEVFRKDPKKFWDWKRPLLLKIWDAQPNPAHLALAQLEAAGILKAVVTQNIDMLHQRAGSMKVFPVHGSVENMTCLHCRKSYPSRDFERILRAGLDMPRCPTCQVVLKPDIVLYQEMLPKKIWEDAEKHCNRADVMLVIGSSLEVWPASRLPEMAVDAGARLILINLSPTPLDDRADVRLEVDAAVALPAIAGGLL